MRKRRRLANKMTMMVCAVLIAVSVFFYAPIEASAEEVSYSDSLAPFYSITGSLNEFSFGSGFGSGFNDDVYYRVTYNCSFTLGFDALSSVRSFLIKYENSVVLNEPFGPNALDFFERNFDSYLIAKGSVLNSGRFNIQFRLLASELPNIPTTFDFDFVHNITSITPLTGEESASYQQGYNAGYSAGEQVGESNGYSNGYSDGFEAGEQNGYDSGFEAGKESVDTQSYYDMGYSAGYDAGYLSGYDVGYDDGYDAGWSAYEAQMDKWGADTSDYPLKISSFSSASQKITATVFTSVPSISYEREVLFDLNFDINPNHTYKYVVKARGVGTGLYDALFSDYDLNLSIGSNTFDISRSGFERAFYIPGYNMDSLTCLEMYVYDGVYYGGVSEEDGFLKHIGHVSAEIYDFFIDVYDMGPSGDTQNHIANQTDKLTNGFNDSKGNSVNSDFSSGLNDFETAEDSLFATATTGLKDFTFFDIQSVPAMVTGMSFVGSIMSGWFTQAGGASGVGIVLSILFSIMLVAMVLGLYRWYQSKGGKD